MESVKYFQGEIKEFVQNLRDLSFPWAWTALCINLEKLSCLSQEAQVRGRHTLLRTSSRCRLLWWHILPLQKTCLGKEMWTLPELQFSVVTFCIFSSLPLWLDSSSERPSGPMSFQNKSVRRRIVNKNKLWTRTTLRSMNHVLQVKITALSHCASRYDCLGG